MREQRYIASAYVKHGTVRVRGNPCKSPKEAALDVFKRYQDTVRVGIYPSYYYEGVGWSYEEIACHPYYDRRDLAHEIPKWSFWSYWPR